MACPLSCGLSRVFFGRVFKTARALAKARKEGKLPEDWESQLDELLGIDSQQRHETEAFKEADAIANEALYAGGASYSEENPGSNGETFSLAASTQERNARPLPPIRISTEKMTGDRSDMRKAVREYIAAVDRDDMVFAQRMVDEAAKDAGYQAHADFRDAHRASSGPAATDEEVRNGDMYASLLQVAGGVHNQPEDCFDPRVGPRYHSYGSSAESVGKRERGCRARHGQEEASMKSHA